MTDREIPFNSLPSAVIRAFNDTIYSQAPWTVDDEANVLERADSETFYVIEVDKNENGVETDVDLYYTETAVSCKLSPTLRKMTTTSTSSRKNSR